MMTLWGKGFEVKQDEKLNLSFQKKIEKGNSQKAVNTIICSKQTKKQKEL